MTETNLPTPNAAQEEIVLRCNRCNKPITPETAVLTPTGYRCKDCVRSQQKIFDTNKGLDVPVGLLISALIAFGGSWLAGRIGFLILFVAPGIGTLIANVVRWAVRKRRSQALNQYRHTTSGCMCPLSILWINSSRHFRRSRPIQENKC